MSKFFATTRQRPYVFFLGLGFILWAGLVGTGYFWLTAYVNAAGSVTNPPPHLDQQPTGLFTLKLFIHPHCPCSQATAREFARLMARAIDRVQADVFVYCPSHEPDSWSESSLVAALRQIPGVRVNLDRGGDAATANAAMTSGELLLYDSAGQLQFHGGITPGRGHEGDNRGAAAILDLIHGKPTTHQQSPVFGCVIHHE